MSYNPSSLTIPPGIAAPTPYPTLGMVPVEAFGAVGDAYQITDGAITSGLKALTSPGNHFVAFTGTKTVVVNGAGATVNGLATDLVTTATYVNAGRLNTTAAAGNTVSGATVSIGTDNTTPIQNALNSALAPNLVIAQGLYLCGSGLVIPGGKNLYGSGGSYSSNGILGAGSLYSAQANIPTDPIAGTGGSVAVTSATESGNVATYNLTVPSWLVAGAVVTISGMLPSGYNFTGKVLSVGGSSFTMTIPSSGLGSSTQAGTATSQAGKKYVAYSSTSNTTVTNVFNLNFTACNYNTTVAWGVLWPNTGGSNGNWLYNFYNCIFNGWVGRHLMWANGVTYTACIFQGTWCANAFTMPSGLTYTGVVQKVTDVGCIFSQEQNVYGQINYESNQSGAVATFSVWKMFGGSMEFGYGLGDFTGINYGLYNPHVELLNASVAALIINVASASEGIIVGPDLDVTGGQATAISSAFNTSGNNASAWIWISGNIGATVLTPQTITIPGSTTASGTFLNLNNLSTAYTRGIDIELAATGSDNYAALLSLAGAGTANTALYLSASGASTNTALNINRGRIISGGTTVLPTSDPHVVGQWWNNSGVVTVSAG